MAPARGLGAAAPLPDVSSAALDFETLPPGLTASAIAAQDIFRLAEQADQYLKGVEVDVADGNVADGGARLASGTTATPPAGHVHSGVVAVELAAADDGSDDKGDEAAALAAEGAKLAALEEAAARKSAEQQSKLDEERAALEQRLATAEAEVAAELRKRAEELEGERAAMRGVTHR